MTSTQICAQIFVQQAIAAVELVPQMSVGPVGGTQSSTEVCSVSNG